VKGLPNHPAADPARAVDLLVTEYTSLKAEQQARIGTRDNLLYATMVAMAGVLTLTLQGHRVTYLLLTPPVSLILGWTYLANDTMITALGRYIRRDLAPWLAALTASTAPPLFGWETAHWFDPLRKMCQLTVDLLSFVAVVILAVQIIRCAELTGATQS
jgi:hypothetical protein